MIHRKFSPGEIVWLDREVPLPNDATFADAIAANLRPRSTPWMRVGRDPLVIFIWSATVLVWCVTILGVVRIVEMVSR